MAPGKYSVSTVSSVSHTIRFGGTSNLRLSDRPDASATFRNASDAAASRSARRSDAGSCPRRAEISGPLPVVSSTRLTSPMPIEDDEESWVACRPGYFLPVTVLSQMFRGLFRRQLWSGRFAADSPLEEARFEPSVPRLR
jgi:hypothetical protein